MNVMIKGLSYSSKHYLGLFIYINTDTEIMVAHSFVRISFLLFRIWGFRVTQKLKKLVANQFL